MSILGNIFLIIATLFFVALLPILFSKAPSGDAAVGYAWSLVIFSLGFMISIVIVALFIGGASGYEWVSDIKAKRFRWVAGSLIAILITWACSVMIKTEGGPQNAIIKFLVGIIPVLIPVILIGTAAILLNSGLRSSVPLSLYKVPLVMLAVLGMAGTGAGVVAWIASSAKQQIATIKSISGGLDDNQQRIMADIEAADVTSGIWSILVFTGDNQPPEIQQNAVTKVKLNPNWEAELIRLLDSESAPEVFQFLASNDVDHPALFIEPVHQGILIQAKLVRQRIRNCSHPSHFYAGMFVWDVERVIRTVDRFKEHGGNYLEPMKELRAAMDEPSGYEKPKFSSNAKLDKWIKKNS